MFDYSEKEQEIINGFDAWSEGVEPGGLRNKDEIKMLICYLLKTIDQPISMEQIGNIMQDQGIANYFEAMDAVSDLISNGSISSEFVEEKQILSATEIGKSAVEVVEAANRPPKRYQRGSRPRAGRFPAASASDPSHCGTPF